MYTTQNNRQRERQLDEEEEEEATDRCIQHRTIDRERQFDEEEEKEATDRQMYTTQNNRQREIVRQGGRKGGYRQIDVYNIEQQIEREIVR